MNGAIRTSTKSRDFDKRDDSENLRDAKRAVFALDSYTRGRLKSVFSGHGNWVAERSSNWQKRN